MSSAFQFAPVHQNADEQRGETPLKRSRSQVAACSRHLLVDLQFVTDTELLTQYSIPGHAANVDVVASGFEIRDRARAVFVGLQAMQVAHRISGDLARNSMDLNDGLEMDNVRSQKRYLSEVVLLAPLRAPVVPQSATLLNLSRLMIRLEAL